MSLTIGIVLLGVAAADSTSSSPPAPAALDFEVEWEAAAAHPPPIPWDRSQFPLPPELRPTVDFWKAVFSRHGEDQILLHDRDQPWRVYGVVDLVAEGDGVALTGLARRRALDHAADRIRRGLRRVAQADDPSALEGDEARLAALFAGASRSELKAAPERLHLQRGIREKFAYALEKSGRFLPGILAVLREQGVPQTLAALPFIESSFQVEAHSSARAVGLWQLMAATVRGSLQIDDAVDERRDPFLSTAAAAAVLRGNYEALGSWPLAVVAYNYGLNGMKRAVRRFGNQDFLRILREHDGRAFGYAGRNFYPEFLAALELYGERSGAFPEVVPERPENPRRFVVQDYVPLPALSLALGLSRDQIREYNPALLPSVLEGRRFVPAGYQLHLPPDYSWDAGRLYASMPEEARHGRQKHNTYTVQRGDTLARIAARFSTTVAELARINDLRRIHVIHPGQRLIVE